VTGVPLLALGIDSYATVSIQHSIQRDLQAHVTAADLAHAASVADLAARLDEQITARAEPLQGVVPEQSPGRHAADRELVRVYCWTGGSRVPLHADSDPA
jgi:hypothetical protein